jgi:hypothetical protein
MINEFEIKVPNKVKVTIDDAELTIARKGFMSFGNGLRGEKTIPLQSITAIQLKKPGAMHGYIQFSLLGAQEAKGDAIELMKDENTIVFAGRHLDDMMELKRMIESRNAPANPIVQSQGSSAAMQIKEFKELLDDGIITQEEFESKKKQLLGI